MNDTCLDQSFDRFDIWHDATCRTHSITQCSGRFEEAFNAKIFGLDMGRFGIGETSTSSRGVICSRRDARDIRRDRVDDLMLLLVLEGEARLQQNEQAVSATRGGMLLYEQAKPFALELAGPHRLVAFNVPRSDLLDGSSDRLRHAARVARPETPVGRFAASTLSCFLETSRSLDAEAAARLAPSVLDIVAAAFAQTEGGSAHRQVDLLRAAAAYVDRHIAEPLSVPKVAAALNVSPRTLNRLFAAEGTTPIRWIRQRRLLEAYTGLKEGRFASVTEAALTCGFVEHAHFSRAFRAAFARTPSEVRRSGR